MLKRIFFVALLFASLAMFLWYAQPEQALTTSISSSVEWDAGTHTSTESYTTEGQLKLESQGSWGARTWKHPDKVISAGSAYVSVGAHIYVTRGLGDIYFWRYSPTDDTWTTLTKLPRGAYYGADFTAVGDSIYAIFGGYQRAFAKYSISNNSWEMLEEIPDIVYRGGSLTNDGTDIYAIRGNTSQEFYKYTVSTGEWSPIAGVPATVAQGSDLVYDDGYIYTLRGNNTTTFYRYDIAANTWTTRAVFPVALNSETQISTDGSDIYVGRQTNTTTFYKYNIAGNSWSTLTAAPLAAQYGATIYHAADGYVYFFRGNGDYRFWKYNVAGNAFVGPEESPVALTTGADLVYNGGYMYAPRGGGTNTFYRYTLATNVWTAMTNSTVTYSDDTKGVSAGNYLYFLTANNTNTFYRYDISGNSWSAMATTPAAARFGASLAYPGTGDYIYGTRGAGTLDFWRYSIGGNTWDNAGAADLPTGATSNYGSRMVSNGTDVFYISGLGIKRLLKYTVASNTWTDLTPPPFAPYYGTDVAYANGKLLFTAGWYTTDFWEYTISTDTWRKLPSLVGILAQNVGPWSGASLEYDGTSSFYFTFGNGRQELEVYTPAAANFPASGTWVSPTKDLTYVSSWTSFVASATTGGDSAITYETRTSSDASSWSGWQAVSGSTIASPTQRFIQIRATLTSSTDQSITPILSDITINYVGDGSSPSNPSTTLGYSQEIGGVALTSGNSYNYAHPYFSWSGASDAQSAVAGYYVYFGTDVDANPVTQGELQTTATYTGNTPMETGTYFLRIGTVDTLGNQSSAITAFVYDYVGVSPYLTTTVTSTADFSGTASNVSTLGDQLALTGRSSGFWSAERLTLAPATLQYGARNVGYVPNSNKLYVFRGANVTTFYEYDIDTDIWTTLANAPANVYQGGGVVEGPDGYLYGWAGNNSSSFWRYDITNNTWASDISSAPLTVADGGSLVYDGTRYIYALRGNSSNAFWRYDTQLDEWSSLAATDFGATIDAVNNLVGIGGSLTMDVTNGKLYAIQGSYLDGFAVYDKDTDAWTVLEDLPMLPYNGASIEFDSTTNAIYFMPGENNLQLFKYSIADASWSQLSSSPGSIGYGASLQKVGTSLYTIRGTNTNNLYRYDITKDSWFIPTRGLFSREFESTSYLTVSYGSDLVKGDGNYFYFTRGNYADDFMRWDETTGQVTRLANAPQGTYVGSTLAYDTTNNLIYLTSASGIRDFFVYNIAANTWSKETNDPIPATVDQGASMVYDGSRYMYLIRGSVSTVLYRFDTQGSSGSKWTTLTGAPAALGYGSELVLKDGYIYTLRGQNIAANPFYRYSIAGNSWTTLTSPGVTIHIDGFLTDGGDGYLYAGRGNNLADFYRYNITAGTWSTVTSMPANLYNGGSGKSNGSSKIYMIPGPGTNTYADALYTYVMPTSNSSFVESGSYTSATHDFTSVYQWANLTVDFTKPSNTGLTIETRSSADESVWSDWTATTQQKQTGTSSTYKINSTANRYLQVRFSMTSADGVSSPKVQSYAVHYYQDTDKPTNPLTDGLTALSASSSGTAIVSGVWYNHPNPQFTWPTAEATNGASDTTTGSGVSGYYVYFGSNASADPLADGALQTASSYVASGLSNDTTYYLRIRSIDAAGNVSDATWQPFIYKYDTTGSTGPTNLAVDPSGYSAIDNFDFTWSEATTSGATIVEYCYKTGAASGSYSSDQCTTDTAVNDVPSYQAGSNSFLVRAHDQAGNYSDYSTISYFYADADNAPAPPTNLSVDPSTNTANSFAFDWDPPATGTYFGSVSNLSYYYSINALPTEYSTSFTSLTYLNAGAFATLPGDNIFYIVSKDEAGNIDYDNYASVTFSANTSAPGIPLNLEIADVSIKSTSAWRLALSWDEPDSGSVASYAIYRSTDGATYSQIATSGGNSYVDMRLTQVTYYYKVKACDSTNNCGAFSTSISMLPDGRFTDAAELVSEPTVSEITTRKAMVSWATSRTSDSKVSYGTGSGSYFDEEVSNSEQASSHELTLNNLSPGTTYYYIAKWTDEDGNTGTSEEATFETAPPPTTEEPVAKNVSLGSALIEFTSSNASKIVIYYGETSTFGGLKEVATGTSEAKHTVEITGLKDGTKYYYKINAFDSEDEEYEGEIHSFTTLPRPKVSNITIEQVQGAAKTTLLVRWQSNTPISSIVTYYPVGQPGKAQDEVNIALKNGAHRMIIYNLEPQTNYSVIVRGKDVMGNETTSEVREVVTSADTRAPQITDLKVESEILGTGDEATAQLVVSFMTDEPATSQIEYGEGSGTTYSQKTQEDTSLTSRHLVVISGLSPTKVYHLRALSADTMGNRAQSIDKVVVTPKATENALDLVITNLSGVFSFLGSSGQ